MHGSILDIDFCPLADITGAIASACDDLLVVYMHLDKTAADRGAHCRDSQYYRILRAALILVATCVHVCRNMSAA